jgi:hypothetical protein
MVVSSGIVSPEPVAKRAPFTRITKRLAASNVGSGRSSWWNGKVIAVVAWLEMLVYRGAASCEHRTRVLIPVDVVASGLYL